MKNETKQRTIAKETYTRAHESALEISGKCHVLPEGDCLESVKKLFKKNGVTHVQTLCRGLVPKAKYLEDMRHEEEEDWEG
jgi:hypothetical protein